MKERKMLVCRMQTPDGTILTSLHTHHYVTHDDANGKRYMLDGGNSYRRMSDYPEAPMKDVSIYSDSTFKEIRKYVCRGGRGKNGDEPLKWVPISEMSNSWLINCISYNWKRGIKWKSTANRLYVKELIYRTLHGKFIKD